MPSLLILLCVFLSSCSLATQAQPQPKRIELFDGKTFTGWEGDTQQTWRTADGAIVGGSLNRKIPRNEFLASKDSYDDFVLRLKFKLLGDPAKGFVNSGVQIRSERLPNSHEMIGYQCDLGDPTWWGCVYDESRRNRVLAQSDLKAVNRVLKRGDWNDYEIRAEGRRIRTFINGTLAVDYTETDQSLAQKGKLGLQIHSGGPAEVWFKDISIEPLSNVPAPPEPLRAAAPPPPPHPSPLTPEEQAKTFGLPPGYEIELVASEPDVGKPITVAWDAAGRLWTMTALEYPVDGNEDAVRSAALFSGGGRDRVLVIDAPAGPGPHRPRVFADGLAIPLGLLPLGDGCLVQFGPKILRLRDRDGDGRAEERSTFLEGFGTQDSHLFPHQFTRGPGGWLYFAQGAFNHSRVKRPEGGNVRMSYCKMARVRLDGTGLELVQAGLNNIWGFVIDRHGEMFIQEANDLGYPVVPLELGANFPGIGMEKLKPYAPWTPPLPHDFHMGGTGLSGLALLESPRFAPAALGLGQVFFIANPITRQVQVVAVQTRDGQPHLVKLPEFLVSSDPWFRPVSIHFGPDECLYVVDWYNAVISHNEVPRNHPDRDKTRGRIWRIRRQNQPRLTVPNLTQQSAPQLVANLGSDQPWLVRHSWQQLVDRRLVESVDTLKRRASEAELTSERLAALWALEGLGSLPADVLRAHLASRDRHVRREAARLAGRLPSLASALGELHSDADPGVRAAAIRSLGQLLPGSPDALPLLLRFGGPEIAGPTVALEQGGVAKRGPAHDRDFERYLIRGILEEHRPALARLLISQAGGDLPSESLAFAALVLDSNEGARFLAKQLLVLQRPPHPEEFLRLQAHLEDPGVRRLVAELLEQPRTLRMTWNLRDRLDHARLAPLLVAPTKKLWNTPAERGLACQLAATFKLTALEPELSACAADPASTADRPLALAALRAFAVDRPALYRKVVEAEPAGSPGRREAILALADIPSASCQETLLELAEELSLQERRLALGRLLNSKAGALAFVEAVTSGRLPQSHVEPEWLEKLQAVLRGEAKLQAFLESQKFLMPILLLDGQDASHGLEEVRLEGPFTVEGWVRLNGPIGNRDSLLGRPQVADFNFHDGRFRLWGGPALGDLIIAKKPIPPAIWTHVAVTRDAGGALRLYLNGELDTAEGRPSHATWTGLRLGHSNPAQGTAGAFAEVRLWSVARSPDEIRADFDRQVAGKPGLIRAFRGGDWGRLGGGARIAQTTDHPPLVADQDIAKRDQLFDQYRQWIREAGDREAGKRVFEKNCQNCHAIGTVGGNIGPTLAGAGLLSDEALLRNLLTPSAAMEPGYRLFRVELRNGTLREGFLVRQTDTEMVLRRPGEEDERIEIARVAAGGFTRRSVMPEGLLESLKPGEVRDLFSYLRTLK